MAYPRRLFLSDGRRTKRRFDTVILAQREPYRRYDSLRFDSTNKIVLPGGTKEVLTMLPAFEYAKQ